MEWPAAHGNLTEVDGSICGCMKIKWNFMEGPVDAQKIDGRSHACMESCWKLTEVHKDTRKLVEVDGRSHGHKNLTDLTDLWKVDGS